MSKDLSYLKFGNSFLCVILLIVLLLSLNEVSSSTLGPIVFPPQEMQGSSYVPEDDSEWVSQLPKDSRILFTEKAYYLPRDLSDWSQFSDLYDRQIESVRIFIIGDKKDVVDVTIKDPKDCGKFYVALQPRYILREPSSDFGRGSGAFGGGAVLGSMEVRIQGEKKPLIIGIAKIGFYLDVWYGSTRQTFHSKTLSVVIDHTLKKYSNYRIPEPYLAKQSGVDFLTLPDELQDLDKK